MDVRFSGQVLKRDILSVPERKRKERNNYKMPMEGRDVKNSFELVDRICKEYPNILIQF